MPLINELNKSVKVILLGSGGLSIGQAGEFDYSGTQATLALVAEGLEVIVVNPNIATVQTNPIPGVKIYLYPVTVEWVEKIIAIERPQAIVGGFGGQTALNCLVSLEDKGILAKYGVKNLGTPISTLKLTEDRDLFAKKMLSLGVPILKSEACSTLDEAKRAAHTIGYPIIVRAAYALGGLGSGFANNDTELTDLVLPALNSSPQVLIEKSLRGWKEVEYEVMRDSAGNAITICNMENFDPLGVHTGDSIVVAPSQSLTDEEYQKLRNTSLKIVEAIGIIGECNAQYTLSPTSSDFYIIEVNARLSRSSALASKATGYPIASIAAKIVCGHLLVDLKNPVTGVTSALYEPALDYIAVKIPRWDLRKFQGVHRVLDSTMKSVGEIMAIGRNFPEALQKAIRMVTEDGEGINSPDLFPLELQALSREEIIKDLTWPTDTRIYLVLVAIRRGIEIEEINRITNIDLWFLSQLRNIVIAEKEIGQMASEVQTKVSPGTLSMRADAIADSIDALPTETFRRWKKLGFGDEQIAGLMLRDLKNPLLQRQAAEMGPPPIINQIHQANQGLPPQLSTPSEEFVGPPAHLPGTHPGPIGFSNKAHASSPLPLSSFLNISKAEVQELSLRLRNIRLAKGIFPVFKKIDTTAGEFPSPSNYLYSTYDGAFHDNLPDDGKMPIIVLGGGSYRIGTSVEFDWCAVSCGKRLQEASYRSVIINCNPETVSTDFNNSDRLYFEELTLERILDVCSFEKTKKVVVSMGGQLPNKLANCLAEAQLQLVGHSAATIDMAENRSKFSELLDHLGIDQPRWVMANSRSDLTHFIEQVGFPVLIRPSYVLSGAAMKVAYDHESLQRFLTAAVDISPDHPVVVSEFFMGAREIEVDGVAQNGELVISIVSEHIENAGVHSGDATTVVPPQKLYVETVRQVKRAARLLAQGLKLNGPFNIQFLAKNNSIKVIECNARAARSFPFISKTIGANLAEIATDVMIGRPVRFAHFNEDELPYVGVKAAMFSFTRLRGADPTTGVEMASTGEVGCIAKTFSEALLLAMEASHVRAPKKGVLISAGPIEEKQKFVKAAQQLQEMGIPLYATEGTAKFLQEHGIKITMLNWPGEGERGSDVISYIKEAKVDLVLNIPKNNMGLELRRGILIRQAAAQYGRSLLTDIEKINAFILALYTQQNFLRDHVPVVLGKKRSF